MSSTKKKTKILYEIRPSAIGGMERFLYNLIKHLDKKKFEPIVVSDRPSKLLSLFKSMGIETKIFKLKYGVAVPIRLLNFLKISKIDIVQSNYHSATLALTAHAAHIPHVWHPGGHINVAHSQFTEQEKRCLLKTLYYFSVKIICFSKFVKEQFREFKKTKIKIIHCGIDIPQTNHHQSVIEVSKNGVQNNLRCFSIAMVAHFQPQKRHVDFIRAAEKVKKVLPNTKFFIIGSAHKNQKSLNFAKSLHQMVKRMKMSQYIQFTGFCKDISKFITNMDLIVLPSINEGLGISVVEAMALKKPVIGADSGGLREVIEDEKTGFLVPPKNPNRLAQAMIEILKNPIRAKQMGEAGKKRVQQLFDIVACARQYECLYQMVHQNN